MAATVLELTSWQLQMSAIDVRWVTTYEGSAHGADYVQMTG